MQKKNISIILFLIFCLLPIQKINAQASNAGFIPANIWYSPDYFGEGDKVKIYTVVFNPDSRELSGSVIFFDNNIFFAKKDFTVSAKSVKDISIEWTASVGDHIIFAKIENAKFLISPGKYEEVYLAENQTSKSSRTVAKKIIAQANNQGTTGTSVIINSIIDNAKEAGSDSIKNIGEIIEENTPEFISKPTTLATNIVETFRQDIANTSKKKQAEAKKELDKLNSDIVANSKNNTKTLTADDFMKPLKFTELFALALFSNIFDNKFIFYTLLGLFCFLLLYYIVRRVK